MARHRTWADALILFLLAAALVYPVFRLHHMNNWSSIEATFIGDGRMFAEGWPHHLWQPLWYAGTRSDYVYPPGLRYAVAILYSFLHFVPAHAYHIAIGLFYAMGIAAVYLWTSVAAKSRGAGFLAAGAVALLSPCFLLLPYARADSLFLVPWRLHVLMSYGEGPHMSALAVLPLAWLGAWRRFEGGGIRWLLLASGAAAVVVTINFYGATALAITFPLLVWSCYLKRRDWRILRDSAFIAALAYGLTAWWLVPSYLRITSRNLRLVAPAGNSWSVPLLLGVLIAYVAFSFWLRRSSRLSAYAFFIWSAAGFLSLYILGYRWFGFQVAGNSLRLIPELDVFLTLCGVHVALLGWNWKTSVWPRAAVAVVVALAFLPSFRYLRHFKVEFPSDKNWQQRVEYKTPSWLAQQFPDQRVFVSGTIRFWYNVWHDGTQADGGSDQGILNPLLPAAKWVVTHAADAEVARAWLQTLAADIVVVPGPSSQEAFKEFDHPRMYDAAFPLLRDDGEGNRYYRVPRRAPGIARLAARSRLEAIAALRPEPSNAQVAAYAQAIEELPPGGDSPERAQAKWRNDDALDVNVESAEGELLLVQETFDPYWRAVVDGHPQAIGRDPAGFMTVVLPRGKHLVQFAFQTPTEMIVGRVVSLLSLVLVIFLTVTRLRRSSM